MVEDHELSEEEESPREFSGETTNVSLSIPVPVSGTVHSLQFQFSSKRRTFTHDLQRMMMQLGTLIGLLSPTEEEEAPAEIQSVTTDYQATVEDDLILADATSDPLTVTLVQAENAGVRVEIVKTDSGANAVTIAAKIGDTIEGSSSKTLSAQYDKVSLVSDGVHKWYFEV